MTAQFCEQLDDNLLFRWLLGMNMVEESFDASTFSNNRQRLMAHEVAQVILQRLHLSAGCTGTTTTTFTAAWVT